MGNTTNSNMKNMRNQLRKTRKNKLDNSNASLLEENLKNNFLYNFKNIENLNIASFYATIEEFSPKKITEELSNKNKIYYPIIHPILSRKLWFAPESNSLVKNKYNIIEPNFNKKDVVAPWEIDMVLVPLVGFNNKGYRLGMGGGFYDSSFSFKKKFTNTIFIGVALDEQQSELFTINEWDIKLDYVVTQTKVLSFNGNS